MLSYQKHFPSPVLGQSSLVRSGKIWCFRVLCRSLPSTRSCILYFSLRALSQGGQMDPKFQGAALWGVRGRGNCLYNEHIVSTALTEHELYMWPVTTKQGSCLLQEKCDIPFIWKSILLTQRWYHSPVNWMQHCILWSKISLNFFLFSFFFPNKWSNILKCILPTTTLFWCDGSHIIQMFLNTSTYLLLTFDKPIAHPFILLPCILPSCYLHLLYPFLQEFDPSCCRLFLVR